MLPGRTYTPEDILNVLRKRIWWVLMPFAILAAGAAVGGRLLPEQYRSDALVVVAPKVSSNYVRTAVDSGLRDRLQKSRQAVLSRTLLEKLIVDFDLYPTTRQTGLMEDALAMMRPSIEAVVVRADSFRVSFTYGDPRTAQKVNEQLASAFITESERERFEQAQGTNVFLSGRLAEAKAELDALDTEILNFRRRYNGELPEQLGSNQAALAGLQTQISNTLAQIDRDAIQRVFLQRELANLQAQAPITGAAPIVVAAPGGRGGGAAGPTAASELATQRARLAALEANGYLPTHPDVQAVVLLIQDLEVKAEAEALAAPLSAAGNVGLPQAEIDRRQKISDTERQLSQLDLAIEGREADIVRLREQVVQVQQRIDNTPARQTDLSALTRDRPTLFQRYERLLNNAEDAEANARAEQEGENFALLDEASLPVRPISPNRPMITMAGAGAGLGIGLALLLLFEYRDRSFKTDSDVVRLLSLPVLAVVPFMQSDGELRRATRRSWLTILGMGSTVAGCLAVVLYSFVR